jgi:predicted RNase H-like nuclease (RuvC/YqgF family)
MRRTILISLLTLAALPSGAKQRFSYMYARGNSTYTISAGNVDEIVRVHKRFRDQGEYVWAKMDGREYIIRDPGILAEVRNTSASLKALEPDQRALHAKMSPLEQKQDRLEEEYDRLSDKDEDEEVTDADRDRMRELRAQIRDVERQLRVYEREEEELDRRSDALSDEFDVQLQKIVERAIRAGTAERVQ